MSEDSECSDVGESAALAVQQLILQKSKARYNKTYSQFKTWCLDNRVKSIKEDTLLAYFQQKSKVIKCSTMWSMYSMLRCTLNVNENVDISKFQILIAFLKSQNRRGDRPKKSAVFTKENVEQFLKVADKEFLLMKVVLIIGISGACRREELTFLKIENVNVRDTFINVNIPNTKNNIVRNFKITSGQFGGINLIDIISRYLALRPADTVHERFFVNYQRGKCTRQCVGINTVGGIPRKIASYLQLENPASYTGHCFRRTSATLLVNAGADITTLKRHAGWKSDAVAEGYIEDCETKKLEVAAKILGKAALGPTVQPPLETLETVEAVPPQVYLRDCSNVVINIVNK